MSILTKKPDAASEAEAQKEKTKPDYAAPDDAFPRKGSSASGTDRLYSVEARLAYHEPRMVAGTLLDLRWRRVRFQEGWLGVPTRLSHGHRSDLLSYQAAQALRWWFIAQADVEFSCLCVETRLIEHSITYQWQEEAIRAVCVIDCEGRGNIMPGKQEQ